MRAQRLVAEHDCEARRVSRLVHEDRPAHLLRLVGDAHDPGHARLLRDQGLQPLELGALRPEGGALEQDLGGRDDPGCEPCGGCVCRAPHLVRGRKPSQDRHAERGRARLGRDRDEDRAGDDREHCRDQAVGQEPPRADAQARRLARLGPAQPRPEERAPEERDRRRDRRDCHRERDQHRHRHPRAERAEEAEVADHQRARADRHDQPRGDDDRQNRARRPLDGLEAVLALDEATARAGEEEDRVVRRQPEQQRHEHGLDLVRDVEALPVGDPGEDAGRDQIGERGRAECHERRPESAVHEQQDQGDQPDRRRLHDRQRLVDLAELGLVRRHRPRDAGDRVTATLDPLRERVRECQLRALADARLEVEVRDDRGAVLARRREDAAHVRDRQREGDAVQRLVLPAVDAGRAAQRARLHLPREPVRVVLDNRDAGDERRAEDGEPALLDHCRLRVGRDEPGDVGAAAVGERRQMRRRQDRSDDPGRHDQEAQADHQPGERTHRAVLIWPSSIWPSSPEPAV